MDYTLTAVPRALTNSEKRVAMPGRSCEMRLPGGAESGCTGHRMKTGQGASSAVASRVRRVDGLSASHTDR